MPLPALPNMAVQDCKPPMISSIKSPSTRTASAPFQWRATKEAARSLSLAAALAALVEAPAVLAAPCDAAPAVWPAVRAALAYRRLICCFCQNREMGLLAACAISGLSRKDFW